MNNDNGNEFNIYNPFLASNNNTKVENDNINNLESNQIINNNVNENNFPKQETNTDNILGINQVNQISENNVSNVNGINSNIGLNNNINYNNQEINSSIVEEEKNKQLDSILGVNGTYNNNNADNNDNNNNINNKPNVENEEEMTKSQKKLHNDFAVLLILELIALVLSLTSDKGSINMFNIVYLALTLIGFGLTLVNSKNSGIIGIIIGLAMVLSIITGDIIDAILGIFVIIHSIMCIIEDKKVKN